jgi:predicted HTH domain antitoxin
MKTVTISIPQTISERFTDVEKLQFLLLQNFVIAEYQRGTFSLREAATILKITYNDFIDLLGKYNLSFINAEKSEINHNYQLFSKFMQQHR